MRYCVCLLFLCYEIIVHPYIKTRIKSMVRKHHKIRQHANCIHISRDGLHIHTYHYDDVIMNAIASQITSLVIVYSTVYSDADQSKHQSSASLAFVWGIHRDRWIPRTKGQLRGKCFHLMTSSWNVNSYLILCVKVIVVLVGNLTI